MEYVWGCRSNLFQIDSSPIVGLAMTREQETMKKYQLNGTIYYCPVDLTLSVIGGRWQGLIIWTLRNETKRFNEIKRSLVTINDKMLSQSLKKLVEQEIVSRKSYNEIPPKVEYSLTKKGIELLPIFDKMQKWGEDNNIE